MEIWQLTATELRQKISKGEISAREATESHLSRMDQINVKINAVAQSCETEALKEADLIDDKCLRGDELGALAGVPVTVKINVDQRGYATTNGLQLQKDLMLITYFDMWEHSQHGFYLLLIVQKNNLYLRPFLNF